MGQEIFTVLPLNEQFFGMVIVPTGDLNKIKLGQQVLINLKNFPVEEYGPFLPARTCGLPNPDAHSPAVPVFWCLRSCGLR